MDMNAPGFDITNPRKELNRYYVTLKDGRINEFYALNKEQLHQQFYSIYNSEGKRWDYVEAQVVTDFFNDNVQDINTEIVKGDPYAIYGLHKSFNDYSRYANPNLKISFNLKDKYYGQVTAFKFMLSIGVL